MFKYNLEPEFTKLLHGRDSFSIPTSVRTLTEDDIIHTNKSRAKMAQFSLSNCEVLNAINAGEKVEQNNTVLCNGEVNVRMVKRDDKYIVIDLYRKQR